MADYNHTFRGVRHEDGTVGVFCNDVYLDPKRSQRVWNHSPDGFEWGYGGSGPAQLALAILLEHTTADMALNLHQEFKCDFVCRFPHHGWVLRSREVRAWLKARPPRLPQA
jgi:Family of unknown function (DUF6166)